MIWSYVMTSGRQVLDTRGAAPDCINLEQWIVVMLPCEYSWP